MRNESADPSESVPFRTRALVISSVTVTEWDVATGASLTAVMAMETVAIAESLTPSRTRNAKLSAPDRLALGV